MMLLLAVVTNGKGMGGGVGRQIKLFPLRTGGSENFKHAAISKIRITRNLIPNLPFRHTANRTHAKASYLCLRLQPFSLVGNFFFFRI